MTMITRPLGRTGLNVSAICLGTMTWGKQNTQAEGHAQMDYALERGISFWDTAEMYAVPPSADTYGRTEEIIGSWFASRKTRAQVILASKIAGPGLSWIREGKNKIDRANILAAVEGSLQRLRTDYIDLYQLHWPNRGSTAFQRHWTWHPHFDAARVEDNFLEVLRTLEELIQAGKIRAIGLSNETAWGTMKWLTLAQQHHLPRMASIQNEYSLLDRRFELDLQEVALAEDCGLLAWSPLARGMISGKYLNGARPAGARLTITPTPENRDTPQCNAAIARYMQVAADHGLDVCQMALAFVHARPFVTSTIIGATTMEQLKANIEAFDLVLTPDVKKDIDAVRREYPIPY